MPRAALFPVFGVAGHRVFTAAALAVFSGALFAIFAGAAVHGRLVVFVVFLAAGRVLAFTTGHGLCRLTLALFFLLFTAGACRLIRSFCCVRRCLRWWSGSLRRGVLLRRGWQPGSQSQQHCESNRSSFHFFTSMDPFSWFANVRGTSHAGTALGTRRSQGRIAQRRSTMKEETETPADPLMSTVRLSSAGGIGSYEGRGWSAHFASGDSFRRAGRTPRGTWFVTEQQSECGEIW